MNSSKNSAANLCSYKCHLSTEAFFFYHRLREKMSIPFGLLQRGAKLHVSTLVYNENVQCHITTYHNLRVQLSKSNNPILYVTTTYNYSDLISVWNTAHTEGLLFTFTFTKPEQSVFGGEENGTVICEVNNLCGKNVRYN